MPWWVQAVIGAAAFLAALGVIAKSPPVQWLLSRLVVEPAGDAIERVMEPHLSALRHDIGNLNTKLDAVLAEVQTNGGSSMKDRVNQVHDAVVGDGPG
jgi:hypothetical protein